MEGQSLIITLLVLGLGLGIAAVSLILLHYCQWKRHVRGSVTVPEDGSQKADQLLLQAAKPLSQTEKRYFYLFMDGKSTGEISASMHVEPSSVYTMKYRIRKKFPEGTRLPF